MDYISREDALKIAWDEYNAGTPGDIPYRLERLPAADVEERKVGKWIDTGSGQECSLCNEIQYGHDNFRYFCPNCGAKME